MSVMTEEQKKIAEENHKLIFDYLWRKGLSVDDYYDIAAIALCRAAMTYDGESSKFSTYAYSCMAHLISNYHRSKYTLSAIPEASVISMNTPVSDTDETSTLESFLPSASDLEVDIVSAQVVNGLLSKLTDREKQVVSMLEAGYSYREMAKILGISPARVGHIVNAIRLKAISSGLGV